MQLLALRESDSSSVKQRILIVPCYFISLEYSPDKVILLSLSSAKLSSSFSLSKKQRSIFPLHKCFFGGREKRR